MGLLGIIAFGVILALGGKIQNWASITLRGWWLGFFALAAQLALFGPSIPWLEPLMPVLHLSTLVIALLLGFLNWRLPGLPLMCLGGLANFLAIVLNGGEMPADPYSFGQVFGSTRLAEIQATGISNNSGLIGPHTLVPWLGDIFIWPKPLPLPNVFSIGDILLIAGAVWCMIRVMGVPRLKKK